MLCKQCILLLAFCINIMIAKSENVNTSDSLIVLKVENIELKKIVDSLVEYEKTMEYYDSNLVFYIDIQYRQSIVLVSLGSFHDILKSGNEIGCFNEKKHIFIVSSNYETNFFKITKSKKWFEFYRPLEGIEKSSEDIVIDVYEDDSYTQWNYRLIGDDLKKTP